MAISRIVLNYIENSPSAFYEIPHETVNIHLNDKPEWFLQDWIEMVDIYESQF